ncbi:MAG: serine dehydratase subunit alpha family protein [Clostridium sp.]
MNYKKYTDILKSEIAPAQGCTEPIAVAYATALAMEHLNGEASSIEIYLSPNIIKNALGVTIPGTRKLGASMAAALGAAIRDSSKKLDLLNSFTDEDLEKANKLLDDKIIVINKKDSDDLLYIEVNCKNEKDSSEVIIKHSHTNVIYIKENENVLLEKNETYEHNSSTQIESIESIYDYVKNVPIKEIEFLYDAVKLNLKISEEGLRHRYGLEIGYKLMRHSNLNMFQNSFANKVVASTAAAADARMSGCPLTVMTTGGSGNQGIATTLPVIKTAEYMKTDKETLLRALALSNLITLFIKQYIGRLSPICGSGIAGGTGSSCAIVFLHDGDLQTIKNTVNIMLSGLSGMICDGAKESCALKIAAGTNSAIECAMLALNGIKTKKTDGIIFGDANDTVKNLRTLVKSGFSNVDNTILDIMLSKNN